MDQRAPERAVGGHGWSAGVWPLTAGVVRERLGSGCGATVMARAVATGAPAVSATVQAGQSTTSRMWAITAINEINELKADGGNSNITTERSDDAGIVIAGEEVTSGSQAAVDAVDACACLSSAARGSRKVVRARAP